jgi:hypothetical protein
VVFWDDTEEIDVEGGDGERACDVVVRRERPRLAGMHDASRLAERCQRGKNATLRREVCA